jgi:hypothetical protein
MDERDIQRAFHAIAEQEIQDDMDMWPTIRASLTPSRPLRAVHALRFGKFAIVILILLVSAVAYALYQSTTGDPGLESVQDAKLTTPLNMKQTIGDVSVTLDWAYADSNRVVLAYTTNEPQGVNLHPTDFGGHFGLADTQSNHFLATTFSGIGGLSVQPETAQVISSFDITCLGSTMPEKINLIFDVTFGVESVTESRQGGGGGGGSGGYEGCPKEDVDAGSPAPDGSKLIGPFQFSFEVPIIPALQVNQPQSVTANGRQVTVRSLSITPSMTMGRLCYDVPDDDAWQAELTATMDGMMVKSVSGAVVQDNEPNCTSFEVNAPYLPGKTKSLTLSVEALATVPNYNQENFDRFSDLLAKQGIQVEVADEAFNFNIVSTPENMSDTETAQRINDAMAEAYSRRINGPWTFIFTLQ